MPNLFRLLCACTAGQSEHSVDSKMAKARLACLLTLLSTHCYLSVLAVVLKTDNDSPWTDEFDRIELSCLIDSISTNNPRIEWKKIKAEGPSYVYFNNKVSGDLENRAVIREPATLVITNATRLDTAKYRCEVTAAEDLKSFDEIAIDLVVRVKPVVPKCNVPKSVPFGKSAELSCLEEEGFPKSQYQWFKNREEIPEDPKSSIKFFNSSYTLNSETGILKFISVRKEDAGEYYCRAKNDAGYAECAPQKMEVYDIDVVGIVLGVVVVVVVLICISAGICCAYKRGYFASQKQAGNSYKVPAKGDGVDYVRTEDEGDFRHKSSFVI
ncbi:junctional adhesion molecule 3B isoform X1 [Syngnathus acus]|uniref:junctional adhesion molecule 3B isoform X1 n=1 Tax=Syngnathus acus TaxID=161584 RepID=UPI0018861833|nr:junctional adhesion molecule 3B isoform X1 [Syngnathus acus]